QTLRHREVDVAAVVGADVARNAARAPTEVVGADDVAQEVEAELVAREEARLANLLALDRHRRLPERLPDVDESRRSAPLAHVATSRRAYAGGMPARCA